MNTSEKLRFAAMLVESAEGDCERLEGEEEVLDLMEQNCRETANMVREMAVTAAVLED